MRVTMLDGGHFTSPAGLWRRGEDMERQVRFPVPAYLIEVGEERILVEGLAAQVVLIDGDHDLLGDGSVELLSTPGHTPGHQSVRAGDDLIIGGDVTHFAAGLDPDVLAPGPVLV